MSLSVGGQFEVAGLSRNHWRSAAPIRAIFQSAFQVAGLPYFNPHSLRKTLVQLGKTVCQTPEQFKAWSQNLGHDGVMTTFSRYGQVATRRQGEIVLGLNVEAANPAPNVRSFAREVAREMSRLNAGERE